MTDIPTITQEEAVEVRARLCALLLGRDGADFDGEVHLTSAEAQEVIAALSPNMDHAVGGVDPDLGAIESGHVCKHGVRWPHACQPCDEASWQNSRSGRSIVPPPVNQDAVREALQPIVDKLGWAEWATPEHAESILVDLIRNHHDQAKAALATPPLDNTGLDAAEERPDGAIENLTNFQQQADMHGEFVKVSRQALDETLAYVAALASGDRS